MFSTKLKESDIVFISPPSTCYSYLTPFKRYEVQKINNIFPTGQDASVTIIDDSGEFLNTTLKSSAHLRGGSWKIHKK